jgi:hypothetical protein
VVGHLPKNALYRVTQKKEEEGTLINQIVLLSFSLFAAAAADYDCMPCLPPTTTMTACMVHGAAQKRTNDRAICCRRR